MAGTTIGGPASCDLERVRGDNKRFQIKLKDSAGNPIDVDTYTAFWTIDSLKAPQTQFIELQAENGELLKSPLMNIRMKQVDDYFEVRNLPAKIISQTSKPIVSIRQEKHPN